MGALSSGTRKSRKEHICDLCCETIKKGEEYAYQNNKNSDGFYISKMHIKCESIAVFYKMYNEIYWDEGLTEERFECLVHERFEEEFNDEISLDDKIDLLYAKVKEEEEVIHGNT